MSRPQPVAHRGGAGEAPENTLAAFRYSLGLGIRRFELDVQRSADGALVVIHDDTVERTTNGAGSVGALTLAELKALDAGAWFDPRFEGERIPTLREVLDLLAEHGAGVYIELKSPHLYPGIEQSVAALLAEMYSQGGPEAVCISFDTSSVARLHKIDRGLPLGQLYDPFVDDFTGGDSPAATVLPYYASVLLYPEQVEQAHRLGRSVAVWTVNEAAGMARLAEIGVDAIMSDYPSLLLSVIRA